MQTVQAQSISLNGDPLKHTSNFASSSSSDNKNKLSSIENMPSFIYLVALSSERRNFLSSADFHVAIPNDKIRSRYQPLL